ncbi:hypothetical protein JCM10512_2041 [Bacteroides reticulotermitis JCM 10512]|uniref:Uncharacterized protein n=1 Tax=Bacteroides reticulotermitis JCM 10512 TaxID=1445607 RepID=W4USG7_9BACE|nr:hypothetical protein JCM10512_2041 [Bacteroides reticulotermitis JCM 10512]
MLFGAHPFCIGPNFFKIPYVLPPFKSSVYVGLVLGIVSIYYSNSSEKGGKPIS